MANTNAFMTNTNAFEANTNAFMTNTNAFIAFAIAKIIETMGKGSETIASKAMTNCSETKNFVSALDTSVWANGHPRVRRTGPRKSIRQKYRLQEPMLCRKQL
jgi:hypothetical protein